MFVELNLISFVEILVMKRDCKCWVVMSKVDVFICWCLYILVFFVVWLFYVISMFAVS